MSRSWRKVLFDLFLYDDELVRAGWFDKIVDAALSVALGALVLFVFVASPLAAFDRVKALDAGGQFFVCTGTALVLGAALHRIRARWRLLYASAELMSGLVLAYLASMQTDQWRFSAAFVSGVYVIIRSLDNLKQGIRQWQRRWRNADSKARPAG